MWIEEPTLAHDYEGHAWIAREIRTPIQRRKLVGHTGHMLGVTPADAGLCATCVHAKLVISDRGSTFLRCLLAATDPRFEKYPRLPVLECAGWRERAS